MSVTASEEGVSANCGFSGHEGDVYILELYLNRVDEEGAVMPVAGKTVASTEDGAGAVSTEAAGVEPGVYKATAVWQRGDGTSPVGFRDSPLYDVVRDGENYAAMLRQDTVQGEGAHSGAGGQEAKEQPPEDIEGWHGCSHEIFYSIVQPADAQHDALMAGQCSICGDVFTYSDVPNSSYAAFLEETVQTVRRTGEGEAVISTSLWTSFNREALDAIMEHPALAVTVYYRYEGIQYVVTIPAGADLSGLAGEDGFCGFRYLDQVFGGRVAGG